MKCCYNIDMSFVSMLICIVDSRSRTVLFAEGSNIYKIDIDGNNDRQTVLTATDDVSGRLTVEKQKKNPGITKAHDKPLFTKSTKF